MPDAALLDRIRGVPFNSPFHGEGHRKVWARLRIGGIRTSLRRVLRLMRENNRLAPGRVGQPRGPRNHDGTTIPDAVDTMWGTDMTTTWTAEGQVAVFIAVDHHNAECVGLHAARRTRYEALEPLRQGVRRHFSAIGKDIARGPCCSPRPRIAIHVRHLPDRDALPGAFRARQRSSGHRREMAVRSASSARSRRTCFGSGPSTPSKSSGSHCSPCATSTTPPGSSSGSVTAHRFRSGTSFQPS
jgi:hypothetical protein